MSMLMVASVLQREQEIAEQKKQEWENKSMQEIINELSKVDSPEKSEMKGGQKMARKEITDSDEIEEEEDEEDEEDEEEEKPAKKKIKKQKIILVPRAVSIPEMFNVINDKLDTILQTLSVKEK